jgi:hypothetical protein
MKLNKPRKICYCCDQLCEFDRLNIGGGLGYRCCNCFELYTAKECDELENPPEEKPNAPIKPHR